MKRILIIDDDRIIGEMLKYMFKFKGYKAWAITDPAHAFQAVLNNKVDLIILDNLLLGMNGTHLCAKLKKDPHTKHVPVIMISALYEIKAECMLAGATAFIAKPFEMNIFFEKVESVLACERNNLQPH